MATCINFRKPAECFTEINLEEHKKQKERLRELWDSGEPIWQLAKETRLELQSAFDIKV